VHAGGSRRRIQNAGCAVGWRFRFDRLHRHASGSFDCARVARFLHVHARHGNGSVFQLVPQRFPERVGIMTGVVGAAGGFGGFLLPSLFGLLKDATGNFACGFLILNICFLAGGAHS
jgi:nitrate/nitrite transporter NarK